MNNLNVSAQHTLLALSTQSIISKSVFITVPVANILNSYT